jgi:hypothetical protein
MVKIPIGRVGSHLGKAILQVSLGGDCQTLTKAAIRSGLATIVATAVPVPVM